MLPAKLLLVLGKGGTGRTSLSAALALAHAARGERVALASLGSHEELARAVRVGWGPPPGRLGLVPLDPQALVDAHVARLLPIPGAARLVTSHPAYQAFVGIAPGVRELALLDRLLRLGEEGPDLVVVDGLATGHGANVLEAPRKAARVLAGPVAEGVRRIARALTDPRRTAVLLATTLEDLPVREALELAARLRAGGFPLAAVLANRVPERLFPSREAVEVLAGLADRRRAAELGSELGASWSTVQRHLRAALHLELEARAAEPLLAELRALGLPLVALPALPREEGRLRALAARLGEAGL